MQAIVIQRGSRGMFIAGALSFASSFLIGAIVLSLGAKIAHQLARSSKALLTGALLSVFAMVFSLLARRIRTWVLVIAGSTGAIVALWLFLFTGAVHSLTVFFIASVVAGASYAFGYSGGLSVFHTFAAPHHRASVTFGGFLAGYLAQGIGAPFVGAIATGAGLLSGLFVGATVFGVFFLASSAGGAIAAVATRRRARTAQEDIAAPDEGGRPGAGDGTASGYGNCSHRVNVCLLPGDRRPRVLIPNF